MSSVAEGIYTGLTLEARRRDDQGLWQFGVNMDGAFIVLAVRKLGGVDDDLRKAAEQASQQQQQQPEQQGTAQPPQTTQPAQ